MPERVQERYDREQDFNVYIGAKLRTLREKHDFSQTYVAGMAGMDVSLLSRIESGDRGLKLIDAGKLAIVLHTSVNELLRA